MSNSPLVDVVKLSPNFTPMTGKKNLVITPHHTAGVLSVESALDWFSKPSTQASCNYVVGNDGRIGLCVEEHNRAWTTSSRANDNQAITIEVVNCYAGGDWPISDKAYAALLNLITDICKRNGIKKLNFTGDKSGNLTMHKWFANTNCPGPYLGARFPEIANEVNRRLSGQTTPSTPVNTPTTNTKEVPKMDMLKKGSKGYQVKVAQLLLILNGCSCGSYGADGDFGPATDSAVRKYQKAKGLEVDGVIGPKTWAKLLGV